MELSIKTVWHWSVFNTYQVINYMTVDNVLCSVVWITQTYLFQYALFMEAAGIHNKRK